MSKTIKLLFFCEFETEVEIDLSEWSEDEMRGKSLADICEEINENGYAPDYAPELLEVKGGTPLICRGWECSDSGLRVPWREDCFKVPIPAEATNR